MKPAQETPLADAAEPPRFVVQEHWARTLHYDLRLEIAGTLVSWAVPKGPTKDPQIRRLAVRMPDHPREYALFEGTLPKGTYGAGIVLVWDLGTYEPLRPHGVGPEAWLARGYLRFLLQGTKLHGLWELVRRPPGSARRETWLWLKLRDRFVTAGYDPASEPRSALSGRTALELGGGGEPPAVPPHGRPLEAWGQVCAEEALDLPA